MKCLAGNCYVTPNKSMRHFQNATFKTLWCLICLATTDQYKVLDVLSIPRLHVININVIRGAQCNEVGVQFSVSCRYLYVHTDANIHESTA